MLTSLPHHPESVVIEFRLMINGRGCATGEVVAVQVPEALMPTGPQ
jgi:hypothetical protein